jgi:hypothetical protein
LGVGLAFLLEYLDDGWRSPEEVEQISGVPTYALIPRNDLSAIKPPMTRALPPARSIRSLFGSETPNGREDQD